MGISLEYEFRFMFKCRWILLRTRDVSHKTCTENQNTHFVFGNSSHKIVAVYEITWENIVKPDRPRMKIQYSACAMHAGQLRRQTRT